MWTDLPRPAVIAHRGDKTHAPENTLAAFKLAADKGADAVELDVQLTRDEQVVVFHDPTVDRITNETGGVSKFSLEEIRALDAGMWFSEKFRGEKIPTLDEVFEAVGKRLYLNIELKNYTTPNDDLVSKVAESVKRHAMEEHTLFSSFLPHNLRKARLILPQVPCGLLTIRGVWGAWGRALGWRGDYFALHPNLADVNHGLIDRVHAKGKRVNVWTVNSDNEMNRMIDLEVDGVITGDLELALHFLGRRH